MTFVMKRPHGASKGIVIFTHKERLVIGDAPRDPMKAALARLREQYVVGMHWGHYHDDVVPPNWVDFHLAAPGTVRFRDPAAVRRIPLASRNFIGPEFRDLGLPRVWDVVNIARPIRLKGLDDFLRTIRLVYDAGVRLRVLLLCPAPEEWSESDGWYTDIHDEYLRLFTADERGDFLLLLLRGDGYPFPLSSGAVAALLNQGKTFAFYSEQEGESRSVAEALLCDLVVVCRTDVRGGAADHLDESNSRQFGTLDEARDALIEASATWGGSRVSTTELQRELLEEHSRPRLVESLRDVFADLGIPFEGELDLDDLARQLPSHVLTLPPALRMEHTNDLVSRKAALTWIEQQLGGRPQARDLWTLTWRRYANASRRIGAVDRLVRAPASIRRLARAARTPAD